MEKVANFAIQQIFPYKSSYYFSTSNWCRSWHVDIVFHAFPNYGTQKLIMWPTVAKGLFLCRSSMYNYTLAACWHLTPPVYASVCFLLFTTFCVCFYRTFIWTQHSPTSTLMFCGLQRMDPITMWKPWKEERHSSSQSTQKSEFPIQMWCMFWKIPYQDNKRPRSLTQL